MVIQQTHNCGCGGSKPSRPTRPSRPRPSKYN